MAALSALQRKLVHQATAPDNKPKKGGDLWNKAKTFFTSPAGIVTIIVLAILVHYAWKGHKAEAK